MQPRVTEITMETMVPANATCCQKLTAEITAKKALPHPKRP